MLVLSVPLLVWNFVGFAQATLSIIRHGGGGDWYVLLPLVEASNPYDVGGFLWSPVAGWLWVAVVVPLGLPAWQVLHLGALALIRDWRVVGLALLSWAFWHDVANGNVMTFVLVSAWWALRGSSLGMVAFIILGVLIPRPLMLPVLLWLLWRRPAARWWFGGVAIIVVALSMANGLFDDWLARLLQPGTLQFSSQWNIGPSRVLGAVWIPIGVALAFILARRGWLGLASLAISPHIWPYYLNMALLDGPRALRSLTRWVERTRSSSRPPRAASS